MLNPPRRRTPIRATGASKVPRAARAAARTKVAVVTPVAVVRSRKCFFQAGEYLHQNLSSYQSSETAILLTTLSPRSLGELRSSQKVIERVSCRCASSSDQNVRSVRSVVD